MIAVFSDQLRGKPFRYRGLPSLTGYIVSGQNMRSMNYEKSWRAVVIVER